jgi:hypothetical protein
MHRQLHILAMVAIIGAPETMPINRKGGSYAVSEAERLQQASLSRRAKPRLVERRL